MKNFFILLSSVLVLFSGCFSSSPIQQQPTTALDNSIKSFIFISFAASAYHQEKGVWPDSTASLKSYCYQFCEQSKNIEWVNFEIQTIKENGVDKMKLVFHSQSTTITLTSEGFSGKFDPNTIEHSCEILKQVNGIKGR